MYKNAKKVIYSLWPQIGRRLAIDKPQRQAALLRLIRVRPVENQEQIVSLMRGEGFRVTQASVSRDIRELGLVKLAGRYVPARRAMAATAPGASQEPEVGLITGLEPVGANLIVVRTRTGAAGPVAVVLDQELKGIAAGTIAGDDTVFVAVRSRCDQGRVVARLNAWLSRQAEAAPQQGGNAGRRTPKKQREASK